MGVLDEWSEAPVKELNLSEMDTLVKAMNAAWDEVEQVKAQAALAREKYDTLEKKVLDTLEAAGKSKYLVEGLGTVLIVNRFSFKVPKDTDDKKALFEWIKATKGAETLFGMVSINHQTLNSFTKAELEVSPGLSIPGLGIPAHEKTLSFRKAK